MTFGPLMQISPRSPSGTYCVGLSTLRNLMTMPGDGMPHGAGFPLAAGLGRREGAARRGFSHAPALTQAAAGDRGELLRHFERQRRAARATEFQRAQALPPTRGYWIPGNRCCSTLPAVVYLEASHLARPSETWGWGPELGDLFRTKGIEALKIKPLENASLPVHSPS